MTSSARGGKTVPVAAPARHHRDHSDTYLAAVLAALAVIAVGVTVAAASLLYLALATYAVMSSVAGIPHH